MQAIHSLTMRVRKGTEALGVVQKKNNAVFFTLPPNWMILLVVHVFNPPDSTVLFIRLKFL